jgi:sensor histidine kinase regulating citrate/malate metabolism
MNFLKQYISLYIDGFKHPSKLPKKLLLIIIIKLFIIFAILKLFFFQDFLDSKYQTEEEKSKHIINILTNQEQKE